MAMAIFAPQNVIKVETALKEEVAGLLKDGVTEAELAEAKKGWLQGQTVSRAQDNELANLLTGLAFENRDLQFQADLEKKVSVLTAQQIVEAMRRHVHPEQLSIFKAGDFAKAGVKP
jgi:zinc protease